MLRRLVKDTDTDFFTIKMLKNFKLHSAFNFQHH